MTCEVMDAGAVLADNVDHAGDISLLGDYLFWMDQDGGDVFTMRLP